MRQFSASGARLALALALAFAPGIAWAQGGAKKGDAKQGEAQVQTSRDAKGRKVLKFNALEIEGEHDTPNVIIIQEWTPPKDVQIQDEATDDLDRVFTGIRSLNRQFDRELNQNSDVEAISEEADLRKEERRLLEAEVPKTEKRTGKTSLR